MTRRGRRARLPRAVSGSWRSAPPTHLDYRRREGDNGSGHLARGTVLIGVRISDRQAPGKVVIPMHYPRGGRNLLTNPALDPYAQIADFKVSAVRIEPVREPRWLPTPNLMRALVKPSPGPAWSSGNVPTPACGPSDASSESTPPRLRYRSDTSGIGTHGPAVVSSRRWSSDTSSPARSPRSAPRPPPKVCSRSATGSRGRAHRLRPLPPVPHTGHAPLQPDPDHRVDRDGAIRGLHRDAGVQRHEARRHSDGPRRDHGSDGQRVHTVSRAARSPAAPSSCSAAARSAASPAASRRRRRLAGDRQRPQRLRLSLARRWGRRHASIRGATTCSPGFAR